MTCKILIYLAIASYSAVCAATIRPIDQNKLHAPKEWKLREGHKYWRTSKNQKRADINLMARQLHPKVMRIITALKKLEDGGRHDSAKHRVISSQNNKRRNKLRVGYTSFRPMGGRTLPPSTKYIARSKPESTRTAMKGSQDRDRQIYGNLDNLGITYDKTNQRIMYSVNRKNNPLLRLKKTKRKSRRARKDNQEETRPELDDANNLDELTPENRFPSDDIQETLKSEKPLDSEQGVAHDEVSRDVEPLEDTPASAASFPRAKERLVYGNLDNLGITYGKTNQRVMYSQSRRNTILETLLRLLDQPSYSRDRSHKKPLVVVVLRNPHRKVKNNNPFRRYYRRTTPLLKEASDEFGNVPVLTNTRRNNTNDSDSDEYDSDTATSDYEFNPQNAYTVHKNRYLQNYLWNHKMTGDHINVNPYAPLFIAFGATAPELFYSRKWWYFNQDDFIPFG
ncbi:uncharacterized protein LOC134804818 [Cydia splendana]|uniref:uncharacterized protein LOC134804818 n=1 Tax=Cydia splendana TaxID=1100963 RepID=UPI0028F478B7